MVIISKRERDYLEQNGCLFGDELHRTAARKSKKKTYFATESRKVTTLLYQFRLNNVIDSRTANSMKKK